MKRRQFILSLAGGTALGLYGWKRTLTDKSLSLSRYKRMGHALGTTVQLTIFHNKASEADAALAEAFAELETVESLMSLYRPGSQLCQLNEQGFLNQPHPYLVNVLETAVALSAATDGAFDVTVQPLWQLYAEKAKTNSLPSEAAIQQTLTNVDWRQIEVTPERIQLNKKGLAITLNGIAQGFAADAVGQVLRRHGIQHALIDTGEINTIGHHARRDAWLIGIKHPRQSEALLETAGLKGRCLATSGDYETRFSEDFEHHHLLDPRTGTSPTELSSVSVVAPTAMQADALSTALLLLGKNKGQALLEKYPDTDALFVSKTGTLTRTSGFPSLS